MHEIIAVLKDVLNNFTIGIIIFTALFGLLFDRPKLKDKNYTKECKIVEIISYSYIGIGIIIFIFSLVL